MTQLQHTILLKRLYCRIHSCTSSLKELIFSNVYACICTVCAHINNVYFLALCLIFVYHLSNYFPHSTLSLSIIRVQISTVLFLLSIMYLILLPENQQSYCLIQTSLFSCPDIIILYMLKLAFWKNKCCHLSPLLLQYSASFLVTI